jgi:Cu/Ag efflux pump CusA
VTGAADVKVEQVTGLPMLTLQPKKEVIARYGLAVADVQAVITSLIAGEKAGEVFEGDKRFELIVRLPEQLRQDIEVLKRIPVPLPNNSQATIPLAELVDFQISTAPNQVTRENGKRRVVVTANVRGRDIGSFVNDAQQQISAQVTVPTGYWLGWGGTFEQLQSAQQRLMIVIPVALLLILILLYASLGSVLDGLLVFTGVPLALTGGIVALALRDIPLSISAGVGFIALSGVAVLNGLVMLSAIRQLRDNGMDLLQAVQQGADQSVTACVNDSFGSGFGLYSNGSKCRYWCRSTTAISHSSHWRHYFRDSVDVDGVADFVLLAASTFRGVRCLNMTQTPIHSGFFVFENLPQHPQVTLQLLVHSLLGRLGINPINKLLFK